MLNLKKISQIAIVTTMVALPLLGLAQEFVDPPVDDIGKIYGLVEKAARWLQAFFFLIAGIFIVLAAFGYLTAGGDEEKVKSAKQKLVYAIVAIVVAIFAFVVSTIVGNFIGGTVTAP